MRRVSILLSLELKRLWGNSEKGYFYSGSKRLEDSVSYPLICIILKTSDIQTNALIPILMSKTEIPRNLGDVLLVLFLYFITRGTNLRKAYNYIYIFNRISDRLQMHLQPYLAWRRLEAEKGANVLLYCADCRQCDHAGFVSPQKYSLWYNLHTCWVRTRCTVLYAYKKAEDPRSNVDREQEQADPIYFKIKTQQSVRCALRRPEA